MGTRCAALLATVTLATIWAAVPPLALADCAYPTIKISPGRGAVGTSVNVTGRHFTSECQDVGKVRQARARGIRVLFNQGDRTWIVGRLNATEGYRFKHSFRVPRGARLGDAAVVTEHPRSYPPRGFTVTLPLVG